MVDILDAVPTDGLPAVEVACAEAVGHGVHFSDVVLNIPSTRTRREALCDAVSRELVKAALDSPPSTVL